MAQLLINNEKKFMFIHIHKNGGNSLMNYFLEHDIDFENKPKGITTISARKARDRFPSKFANYYIFSIFRNPWSRFVSFYSFIRQWEHSNKRIKDGHWTFEGGDPREVDFNFWLTRTKFFHNQFPASKNKPVQEISQFDWVTDEKDEVIVDDIFNLSNIDEEWKSICKKIDIVYSSLPITNKTNHDNYRSYYNDESIKHVKRVAEREIDYFGYVF